MVKVRNFFVLDPLIAIALFMLTNADVLFYSNEEALWLFFLPPIGMCNIQANYPETGFYAGVHTTRGLSDTKEHHGGLLL
jgi:hypothetical protein